MFLKLPLKTILLCPVHKEYMPTQNRTSLVQMRLGLNCSAPRLRHGIKKLKKVFRRIPAVYGHNVMWMGPKLKLGVGLKYRRGANVSITGFLGVGATNTDAEYWLKYASVKVALLWSKWGRFTEVFWRNLAPLFWNTFIVCFGHLFVAYSTKGCGLICSKMRQ